MHKVKPLLVSRLREHGRGIASGRAYGSGGDCDAHDLLTDETEPFYACSFPLTRRLRARSDFTRIETVDGVVSGSGVLQVIGDFNFAQDTFSGRNTRGDATASATTSPGRSRLPPLGTALPLCKGHARGREGHGRHTSARSHQRCPSNDLTEKAKDRLVADLGDGRGA
jgi:hypothetical protein